MNIEIVRDFVQNKNFMMFFASIMFMCGILSYFWGNSILSGVVITVILLILLCFKVFDYRKILLFMFIFYAGFFLTFCKIKDYDELLQIAPADITLEGRIVSIPTKTDSNKLKFFLKVDKSDGKAIDAKTFVTVSDCDKLPKELNIGETIVLQSRVRKPFTSTNPSQFDYSAYLRNFNTFTSAYADAEDVQIKSEKTNFHWKLLQYLNNTRNRILKVHSKYLKSPNLEILGGIVFGDDAVATPDYIKNSFINSGLLHILAASGMNVAFIYTFWFIILRFFRFPFKFSVLSGMFVIILYTFMTGLGASVVRAALMFVLAGKLIDRDAHSVSLLSLVAVLMLIYNPAYINDVSFQLSFLVTLGLLTTANIIAQKFEKVPKWIKVPIIIPLVAQIWVAPVQMFYFNTFSLYSVFANISTVNLLSVISFGGFVSSVIGRLYLQSFRFLFELLVEYFGMDFKFLWQFKILSCSDDSS